MKRGTVGFILGLITGAVVFGGSIAYAAGIMATPSANRIFVNGREIQPEAYMIEGRNYLQLRDIAAAVDFSVVWDGANNRVLIDTSRGYDPNETMPVATTPSPQSTAPVQAETPATTEAPVMTIDEMKAEIVRLTNVERVKAGLPELKVLPELMDCAQTKADDMRENHYFGHDSPVYGTPGEMIKSFIPRAKAAGENIISSMKTPQEAVEGWVSSSGHYKTMLNEKYTHIGVGIIVGADGGCWYIQQFVGV